MRKSISIAVVAFVAGALSTWTMTDSGANARNTYSAASAGGINVVDLMKTANDLPVQQYDAH